MSQFVKIRALLDEVHAFNRDGFWTTVPLRAGDKEFGNAEEVATFFNMTTLEVCSALKTGTIHGRPFSVSTSFLGEIGVHPDWVKS